jgi:hypothetical protein
LPFPDELGIVLVLHGHPLEWRLRFRAVMDRALAGKLVLDQSEHARFFCHWIIGQSPPSDTPEYSLSGPRRLCIYLSPNGAIGWI